MFLTISIIFIDYAHSGPIEVGSEVQERFVHHLFRGVQVYCEGLCDVVG